MNKETNLEHYKEELTEIFGSNYGYHPRIASVVKSANGKNKIYIPASGDSNFIGDILDWMAQPYKAPILDDVEKAYLRAVIMPFRNRIMYIYLGVYIESYYRVEFILDPVIYKNTSYASVASLPPFKKGTMYKGMKVWERYTLEELGL